MKLRNRYDWIGDVLIYSFLVVVGIITIYPFLNIIAISFNDSGDTIKGGIGIFPRVFTLQNYQKVFSYPSLITGFVNSVLRTVIGTGLSVFCTACMAFTLSRKDFMARKFFNMLFMITMYVSGGLVPGYLLIRNLDLFNNFLVYILPGLVGAFFVFIMRSYIQELPMSLQESAMIDGGNDAMVFFRIILPLSMPSIATIALFYAVGQWNSWFDTYLFCALNEKLTTLQYELQKILNSVTVAAAAAQRGQANALIENMKMNQITPKSIQMAISVVVVIPIIMVYPFLQRYFIAGMTIGAVKG